MSQSDFYMDTSPRAIEITLRDRTIHIISGDTCYSFPYQHHIGNRSESAHILKHWEETHHISHLVSPERRPLWWAVERALFSHNLASTLVLAKNIRLNIGSLLSGACVTISAPPKELTSLVLAIMLFRPALLQTTTTNSQLTRLRKTITSTTFRLVRKIRCVLGKWRLSKSEGQLKHRRKILCIQSEIQWNDGRDKNLFRIVAQLEKLGYQVISVALPCEYLQRNIKGIFLRPRSHIFADVIGEPEELDKRTYKFGATVEDFYYNGFNLGPFLDFWLSRRGCPYVLSDLDGRWRCFIKHLKADLVVMAHEHYAWGAVPRACKNLNIPLFVVQHGNITESNQYYNFPYHSKQYLSLPDKMFVYTNTTKTILTGSSVYSHDSVIVSGATEWEISKDLNNGTIRSHILRKSRKKRLLFTSSPGIPLEVFEYLTAEILKMPESILRIRLHPRELLESALQYRGCARVEVCHATRSLEDDLKWCDVHLSCASSCIVHAVALRKPTIVLAFADVGNWVEKLAADLVVERIELFESLKEKVDKVLSPESMSLLRSSIDSYFLREMGHSQEASTVIVAEIDKILG